jgi:hypothetical protein
MFTVLSQVCVECFVIFENSRVIVHFSRHGTITLSSAVTLLNLSGESPLSQYSGAGKVATGILGLFATGYVSTGTDMKDPMPRLQSRE